MLLERYIFYEGNDLEKEEIIVNKEFLRIFSCRTNQLFLGPSAVVIDLTRACNYRCLSCWTHSPLINIRKDKASFMKFDLIIKLINDLESLGTEKIILSGAGDPSMHPNFYDICKTIKECGLTYEIDSNLSLVDCDKLSGNGPDYIKVNLSAATPKMYKYFHQIENENIFYDVIEKIEFFKKIGVKIKLVFVLCKANVQELIDMISLAVKLKKSGGYIEAKFNFMLAGNGTEIISISGSQITDLIREIPKAQEIASMHGVPNNLNSLREFLSENISDRPSFSIDCYMGWYISLIKENGDVYSCCNKLSVLGNLNHQSFKDIWQSKKYMDFRKLMKAVKFGDNPIYKKCEGCLNYDVNFSIHNLKLRSLSLLRMSYLLLKHRKNMFR
jgi:radical SAM protein with 4Fe4S-binding SPASM domain